MTRPKRRLLARYNGLATRHSVYMTDAAIEVDEHDSFEVVRKRVFFEDIQLVTLHERVGIAGIFAGLGLATFVFFIALIVGKNGGWIVALFGLPLLVLGIVRMVKKEIILTVFGRRSKARMRFPFRAARARRIYGEICANARRAQTLRSAEDMPPHSEPADELPKSFVPPPEL